jgi:hypothetical protein
MELTVARETVYPREAIPTRTRTHSGQGQKVNIGGVTRVPVYHVVETLTITILYKLVTQPTQEQTGSHGSLASALAESAMG